MRLTANEVRVLKALRRFKSSRLRSKKNAPENTGVFLFNRLARVKNKRVKKYPRFIAALAGVALVSTAIVSSSVAAHADTPGDCAVGVSVDPTAANITMSVDGVAQAADKANPGVYGDYTLSLCKDTDDMVYSAYVGKLDPDSDVPSSMDLEFVDLSSDFVIGFTPLAGDLPLEAEGQAQIDGFTIDAKTNRVTLKASPQEISTLQDCDTTPLECSVTEDTATDDYPAQLNIDTRFSTGTAGAAGYTAVKGMAFSAAAFAYDMNASCPNDSKGDKSFSGIKLDLGGPHFQSDGTTENEGYAQVILPAATVASCFGGTTADFAKNILMSRTEVGKSTAMTDEKVATTPDAGLNYNLVTTADKVVITIDTVTFSQPTYVISKKVVAPTKVKVTKKFADLATSLKIALPPKGSFKVVVAGASKSVCSVSGTTVTATAKGTCKYTLTSLSSKGKTVKTANGSFVVS